VKDFLKHNVVFLSLSLALIIALGLALFFIPKGELHLLLCNRHTPERDLFYRYYTHVAEWFPYVLCVALLLFSRVGDGVFASACQAFSALTTQIIKHIVVAPRPITWFAEHMPEVQLPLADGVQMNYWLSFPSGHTTSFFALAGALCVIISQRAVRKGITAGSTPFILSLIVLQVLLFLLATLGGYSRIYLSQHFAADVLGGMAVGLCITTICYAIFHRYEYVKWYNYRLFAKK